MLISLYQVVYFWHRVSLLLPSISETVQVKEIIQGWQLYPSCSPKPDVMLLHLFTRSPPQYEKQLGPVR